ncbi:AsmA family protein, partial [bacterium]|nr:AsmA family protein [bacterium]
MNKSAKIILIILAILILLPVVAVIGAKIYFTSDRLKAMIMPKIEEQIGREVAVDHIALKIFPNLRVDLTGLEISNPPNQEFTVNTFLRLEELTVDVQLRPLLKKQLKIDEISLIRPEIYLEVKADGTNNYTFDLQDAEPEGTETVDDTTAAQAMSMFIPALNMSGATLEYLNYQSDQHLLIEELNNQVAIAITNGGDNIVFESQMSTEGLSYGSTKSFLISKLPLSVYQEVTFKGAEDKLYLDSVQVAIREIALDLSGTVSSVRTNPLLDLSLNSSKADIEQLLSLVPEEFMKASQGITTKGSFQFAMTIKGEAGEKKQPEIKGSFDVSEGTIQYPGLPKAISDVNVKGRFGQSFNGERYEGSLLVDPFSAVLGQNKVYGKISVRDFNDPHLGVSLKGNINLNEIKDYYPLPEGLTVSGMMIADASVNGKTADPKSIRASGKIDIQKVTVTSATMAKPIENLDGIVTFSNQVIKASNFTMKIGKSDLKMTFNLENYLGLAMPEFASQGKPYATMTLTSNNLYMDDLVSEPKEGEKAGSKSEAKKSGSMLPPINADI